MSDDTITNSGGAGAGAASVKHGDARDFFPNSNMNPGSVATTGPTADPAKPTEPVDPKPADGAATETALAYDYAQHFPEEHREVFADVIGAMKEAGMPGLASEGIAKAVGNLGAGLAKAIEEKNVGFWGKQNEGWAAETKKQNSPEDLGNA